METPGIQNENSVIDVLPTFGIKPKKSRERLDTEEFSYYRSDDFFYLEYSFRPENEENTKIHLREHEAFYVLYCKQGDIIITGKTGNPHQIKAGQSAIIYDSFRHGIHLKFEKRILHKLYLIGYNYPVDVNCVRDIDRYTSVKYSFLKYMRAVSSVFTGESYLPVQEYVKRLRDLSKEEPINKREFQSTIFAVIAFKVAQSIVETNDKVMNVEHSL